MTAPTHEAEAHRGGLSAHIPGLGVLRSYPKAWLPRDVIAGLVLSALLVPQGMAYAELAGLPPITGLYTSILCLLGYAVFGPSRVLVLGPDSSARTDDRGDHRAADVLRADGDPARAIALASFMAVMVGVVMVVAGLAKFGFVADLLSKPTQIGYMNGLAITIVVSQLPKLLGFSVDADGLIAEFTAFVSGVAGGDANGTAATIGIASLAGMLLLQRLIPKIPLCSWPLCWRRFAVNMFDLESDGVDTIGALPQGFPAFTIPTVAWSTCRRCLSGRSRSRWWPLPTPCRRPRRSPPAVASGYAATRRWSASARRTSRPACSRGSRSAPVGRAPPWPNRRGPDPRSPASSVPVVITLVLVFAPALMQYVPQPTLGAIVIAAAVRWPTSREPAGSGDSAGWSSACR